MPNRNRTFQGFTRQRSGERRKTLWTRTSWISATIATPDTAIILFTFTAAFLDAKSPFTIVRTRGSMILSSDQNAATEDQQVKFGVAIVSRQAIAIGVTAVPTPVTDADSDMFFVYEELASRALPTGTGLERLVHQVLL